MSLEHTGSRTDRLAKRLFEEATAAGASRLVFRGDDRISSAPIDPVAISRVLTSESPRKFKFQKRSEGRWIDGSAYWSIGDSDKVIAAIRDGRLDVATAFPATVVARAAAVKPEVFSVALRGLHSRVFERLNKDASSTVANSAARFLKAQNELEDDPRVSFLAATFDLYSVMVGHGLGAVLKGASPASMIAEVELSVSQNARRFEHREARIAVANVLGKLYSLSDRRAASTHFEIVRRLDEQGLIEHFHLETGSKSYFDASNVAPAKARAEALRNSVEPMDSRDPQNSLGLLIGMDTAFYRTYAPLLRFYAQQLPDVDFNFLICGTRVEAQSAVADGAAYSSALARLNQSGEPNNVHHFRMAVPEYVKDEKTFYASARFFAAELMLERYSNAYLMDADLTTDTDPRPYFRRVANLEFATPSMSGFTSLYPWRRYLAGNVALTPQIRHTRMLRDLQEYLAHGLGYENSWTLDQNALAYAIERNRSHYTDLKPYDRPFYQPKFRIAWEVRHQEMSPAH